MKRIGTTVASLVISCSVPSGACFSSNRLGDIGADKRDFPGTVPQGWKTYTYGSARISVPSDWAVEHRNNICPVRSAPGTLDTAAVKRLCCATPVPEMQTP